MSQYDDKNTAPLAFHKFFWFLTLPLGFITTLVSVYNTYSQMRASNWLYTVEYVYSTAFLMLLLACFIGFFQWKSYAWHAVNACLALQAAYKVYAVIVYASYMPDSLGTALGQLAGGLVYAVLVGIYYRRRKGLFIAGEPLPSAGVSRAMGSAVDSAEPDAQSAPKLSPSVNCPSCGFGLTDDSAFCGHCGAAAAKQETH